MTFLIIATSVLLLIIGAFFHKFLVTSALKAKLTRRVHRSIEGEKHAGEYLAKHGYKILGEQVTLSPEMSIDGVVESFVIRADFIASINGRRCVVDAKSGPKSADPKNPETRRRMFEYFHYYDVQDVYIYDDLGKRLRKIRFLDKSKRRKTVHGFIWGVLVGFGLTLVGFIIWDLVSPLNLKLYF